jgi:hypothetical protein
MIRKLLEKYEGTYPTGGHHSAKRIQAYGVELVGSGSKGIEPGGSGSRN